MYYCYILLYFYRIGYESRYTIFSDLNYEIVDKNTVIKFIFSLYNPADIVFVDFRWIDLETFKILQQKYPEGELFHFDQQNLDHLDDES